MAGRLFEFDARLGRQAPPQHLSSPDWSQIGNNIHRAALAAAALHLCANQRGASGVAPDDEAMRQRPEVG